MLIWFFLFLCRRAVRVLGAALLGRWTGGGADAGERAASGAALRAGAAGLPHPLGSRLVRAAHAALAAHAASAGATLAQLGQVRDKETLGFCLFNVFLPTTKKVVRGDCRAARDGAERGGARAGVRGAAPARAGAALGQGLFVGAGAVAARHRAERGAPAPSARPRLPGCPRRHGIPPNDQLPNLDPCSGATRKMF